MQLNTDNYFHICSNHCGYVFISVITSFFSVAINDALVTDSWQNTPGFLMLCTVRSRPNDENITLVFLSECFQCVHIPQHQCTETDCEAAPLILTCYCTMGFFLDAVNDTWQGVLVLCLQQSAWSIRLDAEDTVSCISTLFLVGLLTAFIKTKIYQHYWMDYNDVVQIWMMPEGP